MDFDPKPPPIASTTTRILFSGKPKASASSCLTPAVLPLHGNVRGPAIECGARGCQYRLLEKTPTRHSAVHLSP
jgi:hypothetical protein